MGKTPLPFRRTFLLEAGDSGRHEACGCNVRYNAGLMVGPSEALKSPACVEVTLCEDHSKMGYSSGTAICPFCSHSDPIPYFEFKGQRVCSYCANEFMMEVSDMRRKQAPDWQGL